MIAGVVVPRFVLAIKPPCGIDCDKKLGDIPNCRGEAILCGAHIEACILEGLDVLLDQGVSPHRGIHRRDDAYRLAREGEQSRRCQIEGQAVSYLADEAGASRIDESATAAFREVDMGRFACGQILVDHFIGPKAQKRVGCRKAPGVVGEDYGDRLVETLTKKAAKAGRIDGRDRAADY